MGLQDPQICSLLLRALQAHQDAGGTDHTFQDLADHSRISNEDYAARGGDVAGEIDGNIHLNMVKINPDNGF